MSESSTCISFQDHTAAPVQQQNTALSALLSSTAGKAWVQKYLGLGASSLSFQETPVPAAVPAAAPVAMDETAAKAQRQTAQLVALLSTDAGRSMMQRHLGEAIKRKQQHAQLQHQEQLAVQPVWQAAMPTPGSPPSLATAAAAAAAVDLPAMAALSTDMHATATASASEEATDDFSSALAELHPRVLSAAIAVSRTAPGSADRAAGLALLKQELMQHAPLSTALALVGAGNSNAKLAAAAAAFAEGCESDPPPAAAPAAAGQPDLIKVLASALTGRSGSGASAGASCSPLHHQQQQQQQQQLVDVNAPCMLPEEQQAAASPSTGSAGGAEGQPLTCAMAWAMLQKQNQQQMHLQEEDAAAAALTPGLARHDTQHSMRQDSVNADYAAATAAALQQQAAAGSGGGILRGGSQQIVFKRRTNNSTALRRHFSNANKATRSDSGGFNKPQNVFKKQRKRPLVLWSANSNVSQQMGYGKQAQPVCSHAEPECSNASGSALTGSTYHHGMGDARPQQSVGAAVSAPAALTPSSGVENVLSTLARQEQQLVLLQQQLRAQRELIKARHQAKQAAATTAAQPAAATPPPAVSAAAAGLEMLQRRQPASQAAAVDVDMAEAWQAAVEPAGKSSLAVTPAQQDAQQQQQPSQAGLGPDAILALMTLAKNLAAAQQQQQQQQLPPQQQQEAADDAARATAGYLDQQGWDADILRKLTAALLAA